MAKKQQVKRSTAVFRGYIPVHLTDKEKQDVKSNPGTPEQRCDRIIKYVEAGYRFTAGWDDYNECISASLFDTDVRRDTAGYVLSAKHSEFSTAIDALIYLHEKVYADGWDIERVGDRGNVDW